MRIASRNLLMLPNRRRTDRDVAEELQFHIDMLERKYAQQGMGTAQAKAAASRRFGNFERIKWQCVNINRRSGLVQRVLKASLIVIGLAGLAISNLSSDFKIARIGEVLFMIAIFGRLLLYVRGFVPSTLRHGSEDASLSVIHGFSACEHPVKKRIF